MDLSKCDEYFEYKMDCLARCDESIDLIVLPEDSDVPCYARTKEENLELHDKYSPRLLSACAETAKRCNAVFVNALCETATGYRNNTYAASQTVYILNIHTNKLRDFFRENFG
jgi:hypothetical protein